ncbi:MAG TPA: hypothetical protein PKX38_02390 [Alphaproteobacteria bacterium]|nr:hypothetical protein [Micavibrio sp.]HQX26767.1 hypothetical protein [Alphaproteobacteria bacterium]
MADDFFGLGRAAERLKDQIVDKATRDAKEAAKQKALKETGVSEQNLRDAQDPTGAAQRKLDQKTREAQRGIQNKVDETTGKAEKGFLKGFNGGGSSPDALKKDEEAQRLEEEKRQKTLAEPRGPSELYKKELAEQEELTRKLNAEKEERKKNPPGKSKAELDAEEEQKKYMRPQSYDGSPSTPSGAIPISYEVGSVNPQAKGDLSGDYEKALGLKGADPEEVAPLAKPGQTFKI